jgi:transposase InsO family protein
MTVPQRPNQRWSLDFVSDAFVCGRRFRILCVIDDYSRECVLENQTETFKSDNPDQFFK